MIAVPIKNIDVIPMTKYEYKNKLKEVAHLEYKWIKGFYFTDYSKGFDFVVKIWYNIINK